MWRCRRGTQLMGLGMSAMAIAVVILKLVWSEDVPRPPKPLHLTDTRSYLNSLLHMSLEPVKATDACRNGRADVVVIVPSSVRNLKARRAVRESWGALLPPSWPLVFYVGATSNGSLQDLVTAEAKEHGDVAQDSSFRDSYSNLTLKTLSLLAWAQKSCRNATFALKTDDDVFVNVEKLRHLTACVGEARRDVYGRRGHRDPSSGSQMSRESRPKSSCESLEPKRYINHFVNSLTHNYESYVFGGYLYDRVKTDRNPHSKWYLDPKIYTGDTLPPFLSGTAYIMTSNIIPHLLEEAEHTPLIELEDVYMSGLVAGNGLKLKLSHLDGWSRFRPWWDSPCIYSGLLTAHGLSPSELVVMTQKVSEVNDDECDGLMAKFADTFDSLFSSIFPRLPSKDES